LIWINTGRSVGIEPGPDGDALHRHAGASAPDSRLRPLRSSCTGLSAPGQLQTYDALLMTDATMIEAYTMRTMLTACALAVTLVVPAFAQDAPKKGSDADDAFMTGLRKLGVMAGQAHACSKEADQPKVGQGVIDLATQVSLHFGLQAAFVFSGSFGYGMGHEFDHKTCPQALEDFKALQAKYLGR
jgi:hypothetical protein